MSDDWNAPPGPPPPSAAPGSTPGPLLPPPGGAQQGQGASNDWGAPGTPPDQPPAMQTGKVNWMEEAKQLEQNDWLWIVASVVLPGLGQIMLGQKVKGIIILALSLLSAFGLGLFPVVAAIDAFMLAIARRKRAVGDFELFPQ